MIGSKAVRGSLVGERGRPRYISGKDDKERPIAVAMLFCVISQRRW